MLYFLPTSNQFKMKNINICSYRNNCAAKKAEKVNQAAAAVIYRA